MTLKSSIILLFSLFVVMQSNAQEKLSGAWKSDEGIVIFAGNYFAFTAYSKTEFAYTYGGSWNVDGNTLVLSYEFHTKNADKVGTTSNLKLKVDESTMVLEGKDFKRIDNGNPGELHGTWLFSNRIRNGELGNPRSADSPRKTLKILSGTRFQWIAYNTETKKFMGSGGGTYSTKGGKYTENIDFFSRDNSRVGASLEFDFELKDHDWHHQGLSSKGDPIYEVWRLRE